MAKKKKKTNFKEKTIDLKDVENLTVEQIAAASDTLASENKDKESTLDRYIRQHRSEIESAKKDRHAKTVAAANALDQFVRTVREDVDTKATNLSDTPDVPDSDNNLEAPEAGDSDSSLVASDTLVVDSHMDDSDIAVADSDSEANDGSKSAHHVSSESINITDELPEIAPVFPEIQGSFDTVLLATEDAAVGAGTIVSDNTEKTQAEGSQPGLDEDKQPDELEAAKETSTSVATDVKTDIFSEVSTVPPLIIEDNTGLDSALAEEPLSEKTESGVALEPTVVESKKSKKPVIIGICALVILAAGGLVWANINQSKQKEADNTTQSSQRKSEDAKATKTFDQQYASFFTDAKQTKLKNDQFGKIGELVSALDKLKANADYQSLKKKVDALKTEISVTEAMNANFDKAIIADGVLDKTAVVKDGVKLSYTATENEDLNSLLKEAIAHGQAQQAEKTKAAAASAAAPAVTPTTPTTPSTANQAGGTTNQAAGSTNQASSGTNQAAAPTTNGGGTAAGYGLTTAQYQAQYPAISLETSRSRVPVDPNANLNDAAFVWASGIRELVLQKCRDRGYITGDAYILLPASIQKGNGYYNLYKTDGTYLVSINCKTGYFVGNAAGHADNLDY